MTNINWGLLQGTDIGGAFQQGMEQGQQRNRERATDDALRALIANPNDPNVVKALAKYDPAKALQVQQQQIKQQDEAKRRDLLTRAYGGDKAAMGEAFGIDPELVMKLDDNTREQVKQAVGFVAQSAMAIDRLPEAQRPQAWAQAVQMAESRGMDVPAEYETYSPQVLMGAMAEADMVLKLLDQRKPDWRVIPEGGMVANVNDPTVVQQLGGGGFGAESGVTGQYAPGEAEVTPIIQKAQQGKFITTDELATIEAALGPNGQAAARDWMQKQGVQVGKEIGGKRYVQRGGDWYEVN